VKDEHPASADVEGLGRFLKDNQLHNLSYALRAAMKKADALLRNVATSIIRKAAEQSYIELAPVV
jgi:hypothetical protein